MSHPGGSSGRRFFMLLWGELRSAGFMLPHGGSSAAPVSCSPWGSSAAPVSCSPVGGSCHEVTEGADDHKYKRQHRTLFEDRSM